MPDIVAAAASRAALEDAPVDPGTGFPFDASSLIASAWGRPSEAFGPRLADYDGPRHVARLPGPPYHFISRIVEIDGEPGQLEAGPSIVAEFDVDPGAWYFDADPDSDAMPICALLEASLQPCGWLTVYLGCPQASPTDVHFRNLDGDGRVLAPVGPRAGTLRTTARLRSLSRLGGVTIVSFDVRTTAGEDVVLEFDTTLGYFDEESLGSQVGVGVGDDDLRWLEAPAVATHEIDHEPAHEAPSTVGDISAVAGFEC